ncbi:MAG: tRNA (N(6)-L-threonylcarbamoyladenosine(37)-C(2))-methylthiotransferase [archaeon]|nr:tRNA (N(6)-L-threonylcarbamoyladenosine(37)-C(2))-methylthiotransferase [archaeon]
MRSVYIESYGCSLNKSDGEKLKGFLSLNNFEIASSPESADFVIVNSCAVKKATENKMVRRISSLNAEAKTHNFKLIVSGCLPKINSQKVSEINSNILQFGTELNEISQFFNLEEAHFNPLTPEIRDNKHICIMPINSGCLDNCSFCAVKQSRGILKSHSIESIKQKLLQELPLTKEFWFTSPDTGAFGRDIKTNLPKMLKEILNSSNEDFRIRLGMMNPNHCIHFFDELMQVMQDERIYNFLHIPVQSGSNSVLSAMKRRYSREQFLELVDKANSSLKDFSLATDIIVGFPGETEKDFEQTVDLLKEVKPDVVNLSRYAIRPNTLAEKMPQIPEVVKRERSRIAAKLCSEIFLEKNKKFEGRVEKIFVTEQGKNNAFIGRTNSYKPVVIQEDLRGKFVLVKLEKAFPVYLSASILKEMIAVHNK